MNYEEVQAFFAAHIAYKPGWEFHIKKKKTNGKEVDAFYLQIQFNAPDSFDKNKVERQFCRKWLLSEFMTPTELVRTAFLAVAQAERHEMEETFKYKGYDIFNSHLDVEALATACNAKRYEHRGDPKEAESCCPHNPVNPPAVSTTHGTLEALQVILDEERHQAMEGLGLEPFPLPVNICKGPSCACRKKDNDEPV
jgi:hypothetical protein